MKWKKNKILSPHIRCYEQNSTNTHCVHSFSSICVPQQCLYAFRPDRVNTFEINCDDKIHAHFKQHRNAQTQFGECVDRFHSDIADVSIRNINCDLGVLDFSVLSAFALVTAVVDYTDLKTIHKIRSLFSYICYCDFHQFFSFSIFPPFSKHFKLKWH